MSTCLLRILITGSRDWADKNAIARALIWAIGQQPALIVPDVHGPQCLWDRITVVHGAARGAGTIAATIATAWGMHVEPHPADWDRYGRSAGYRRNAEMLAFPLEASRGTRMCMGLARDAGIRVVDWPTDGAALLAKVSTLA